MQRAILCGVLVALSLSVLGCAGPIPLNTAIEVQKMVWINLGTGTVGVGCRGCPLYLDPKNTISSQIPLEVVEANPATQSAGGK
jgi:hypothetical protein